MRNVVGGVLRVALVLALVGSLAACAKPSRWQRTPDLDLRDVSRMLDSDTLGLTRDERPEEFPQIPVRARLRPCCAFGSALRVRVGVMKIPGFEIGNIRSPDAIGRHSYDAGRGPTDTVIGSERNGLVYTCRGGFIDIAHVRDYADWTLYLSSQIARQLETGATITLPPGEGGSRRFILEPVDPLVISAIGRRNLAAAMAVWAGFNLSVWHEIATWYGWASSGLFSEKASAFSPEDLYSNLLGAKIAGTIISERSDLSEALFNRSVDAWLAESLTFLGAVPADLGESVMAAVDGLWWDSGALLPDPNLVLRRNVQFGNRIDPWLVQDAGTALVPGKRLEEVCGREPRPHTLRNPSRTPGVDFSQMLRFEVELGPAMRAQPALAHYEGRISHHDFPAILDAIRSAIEHEFGEGADRPGSGVLEAGSGGL